MFFIIKVFICDFFVLSVNSGKLSGQKEQVKHIWKVFTHKKMLNPCTLFIWGWHSCCLGSPETPGNKMLLCKKIIVFLFLNKCNFTQFIHVFTPHLCSFWRSYDIFYIYINNLNVYKNSFLCKIHFIKDPHSYGLMPNCFHLFENKQF